MRIGWKLLTVKLVLVSLVGFASAQGLSPIPSGEIDPLFGKALQLHGDVLDAERGIVAARAGLSSFMCFANLSYSLVEFIHDLQRLQMLLFIANEMHDPYDVQTVMSQVKDISTRDC